MAKFYLLTVFGDDGEDKSCFTTPITKQTVVNTIQPYDDDVEIMVESFDISITIENMRRVLEGKHYADNYEIEFHDDARLFK